MVDLDVAEDVHTDYYHPDSSYHNAALDVDRVFHTIYSKTTFINFDITSLGTISTAILHLYVNAVSLTAYNWELKRCTDDTSLTSVTYNNESTITVTTTNMVTKALSTSLAGTWIAIDVTSMLQDETRNRFTIRIEISGYPSDTQFASSHTGFPAYSLHPPYLSINDFYVKTTGDDSKDGLSWANAWATINKAATTVADGTTVHMEHGEYSQSAALKVAPQNAGALGIKYKPEPVGGGDTAATVKVTMT